MSTNFYWSRGPVGPRGVVQESDCPDVHIGKRFAAGGGVMGFTYATRPEMIDDFAHDHMDEIVAADEYGRMYTGATLLGVIAQCTQHRTELIGEYFS